MVGWPDETGGERPRVRERSGEESWEREKRKKREEREKGKEKMDKFK